MNIWFTVMVAAIQLVLLVMGVYVSFRPPKKNRDSRWIFSFIILGLVGLVLTGLLARLDDEATREATKEIHQAEVASTNANTAATGANAAATAADG